MVLASRAGGLDYATTTCNDNRIGIILDIAVSPAAAAEDGAADLTYTFTRTGSTGLPLTVTYGIAGTATAIISFLIRQAYVRNFVGDHPVAAIGRAFAMFHDILPIVTIGDGSGFQCRPVVQDSFTRGIRSRP